MAQAIARKVLVVGGSGFLGESKWQRVEKKKRLCPNQLVVRHKYL
jgi:hypothetical protein